MKKKLLEKDVFYLSLFICICIVAVGGICLTNKKVDKLLTSKTTKNSQDEIHLTKDKKDDVLPTTTESKQNLSKAKKSYKPENSKMSYLGNQIIRNYSEKIPSYSETLDVWEIHRGIDVEANDKQQVKSLTSGTVLDVYDDDKYGMSIKVKYDEETALVYSSLNKKINVSKGQEIKEGQCIGYAGNTSSTESASGVHVHLQAYKNNIAINPMSLLE